MGFRKLLQNRRIHLIVIAILTILTYINILQNNFVWDDPNFFIDWPQIKSRPGLSAYLSLPGLLTGDLPFNHRGVYRPIRSVYYMVSYSLWGENPTGYHIQSIITHLLVVFVIYLITESMTGKRALALIVSLLFALHPIHTEAVTYMTASMDTLGILFFFLSFYFYLKTEKVKKKKGIYLLASLIYGFLAFFTYEITLTLPVLILVYHLCKNNFSFKTLVSKINIFKYYFLLLAFYFLVRFVILKIGNRADYLGIAWLISANQARIGLPEIFKDYISWLAWPANLSITHYIPTNLLIKTLYLLDKIDPSGHLITFSAQISAIYPVIYITAAIAAVYFIFRKYPMIVFGMAWFIISLVPVSSILPQGEVAAERFLYLPSFSFCLLLGFLYYKGLVSFYNNKAQKHFFYILIFALSLTISLYTFKTFTRNTDWKNDKTIWQAAINTGPNLSLPYGALANVYAKEKKYDKSIALYLKGLKIDPQNEKINSDLGLAYEKKGEIDQAIIQHQKTLKINPAYFFANVFLGHLYQKKGNFDKAVKAYQSALKTRGDDYLILAYLGDALSNGGNYSKALDVYNKAQRLTANSDSLIFRIGKIYFLQSKYTTAIENFTQAIAMNQTQPSYYLALANTYKQIGNSEKAVYILRKGLAITKNKEIQDELIKLERK